MGHMINEEYLNKNNIDEYFTSLAKKVNERGIGHHRILVVGGAAMAIKYQDGRSQDMEVLSETLKSNGVTKKDIIENFIRLYGDAYFLQNDSRKMRFLEVHFGN